MKRLNIIALLVVVFINYLANWLPLNGQNTGEVSAKYPVLFTPEGYVFAIWGLIYLLLIGFVIYQALPVQADNPITHSIGYLFILSSALNVLWIFAWHYELIVISMMIMIALLITLIILYRRVSFENDIISFTDKVFVRLPFSIYLGWISVATIANASVLLYDINWGGWGISSVIWTAIVIIMGTLLAIYNILTRNDIAFALVFVWAFVGIGVRHGSEYLLLTTTAWFAAAAIIFMLGWKNSSKLRH